MIDWLLDQVPAYLLDFVAASINALWALLAQTVFITPDVTVLPQVQTISARSLAIVNASFVLVITIAGVIVITRDTIQSRYGIAELGPRLVIGFVAANFSTPICRTVIEFANALTGALTGEGIASRDSLAQLLRVITSAMTTPGNPLLIAIIGLFIGVLVAMLLVAWIVRLITLLVVAGVGPVALACHALPYTDPVARLWWRTLIGCAGTVVLQALALHTTMSVFLDPAANLPALGLPVDPTGTFNLFVVACLLWVTIRIPSLVRRYVTNGGGNRNIAGYVIKLVIVQQLTKGLHSAVGRGLGRTAGRGAATRSIRSTGTSASRSMGRSVGSTASRTPSTPAPRPTAPARPPAPPPTSGGTGWPTTAATASTTSGGRLSGTGWPSAKPSAGPSAGPSGRRSAGQSTPQSATSRSSTGPQAPRRQPGGRTSGQGPRGPRGPQSTGRSGGSDGR